MSSKQRDAHGSPIGIFIIGMNVGDREIRARWVGSSAELARDHHTFTGPYVVLKEPAAASTRRPAQSVLVEEHGAMVLVGDAEEFFARELPVTKRAVDTEAGGDRTLVAS